MPAPMRAPMRATPIAVARSAIVRVAQILAADDIAVTQRGVQAFCQSDDAGRPVRINLPALSDTADEGLVRAAQGFLDHEVAHALFTDFQAVIQAGKEDMVLKNLHNLVEDTFIERRMAERYRGSEFNLEETRKFVLDRFVEPEWAKARDSGDPLTMLSTLLMPVMRAWAGQPSMIAYMADKWDLIAEPLKEIEDLAPRVRAVSDSWESLEVARELLRRIHDAGWSVAASASMDACIEGEGGAYRPSGDEAVFGQIRDYNGAVAEALSHEAEIAADAAPWQVFTRDFDRITPYEPSRSDHSSEVAAMRAQTDSLVGPMAREIERLIQARRRIVWRGGLKRGRLNPSALHRLAVDDTRVFRRRDEHRALDTAIEIVVDLSGSMAGPKIWTACAAAMAMAETLERCAVACEVIGFTTFPPHAVMDPDTLAEMNRELKAAGARDDGRGYPNSKGRYSRIEPLNMPIFKGFEDRMTPVTRARFAAAPRDGRLMHNNIDNESIAIAGERLLGRTESRRIMMVFSDGAPAFVGDGPTARRLLIEEIRRLERVGVEVLGVGVLTDMVRRYYPKWAVINEVAALPQALMRELRRFLI